MEQKVLINNPSRLFNLVSSYFVQTDHNEELKENATPLLEWGIADRSK